MCLEVDHDGVIRLCAIMLPVGMDLLGLLCVCSRLTTRIMTLLEYSKEITSP